MKTNALASKLTLNILSKFCANPFSKIRTPVKSTEIKRTLSITTPQNTGTHSVFQKLPQEIESSSYSQYP